MSVKRFLLAWLAAVAIVFILNGLFHGLLAADFFDNNYTNFGDNVRKTADFNPAPVLLLELLLEFFLAWLLLRICAGRVTLKQAVLVGALFQFCTAATWNLANMATFIHWPLSIFLLDTPWHALMGALSGWIIARIGWKSIQT